MTPADENELAAAIASSREPFVIHGGGTKDVGRPVEGKTLSTSCLTGISRYEPESLTLVVAAGTSLQEIERSLSEYRQQLAFEPMDYRHLLGTEGDPTIGGVVASNSSGPRRIQAGACRDYLLGVRFVDGNGAIIANGGRVMKNVTGYDLVRLMAGSHGTLGVLTEIALKVLPDSESRACLLLHGLRDDDAIKALTRALCSPFEVTGAAHIPVGMDGDPVTMIRVEGFTNSVRYRAKRIKELLKPFGEAEIETDPARVASGWKWVRDVEKFHGQDGNVWRVSVKPGDAPHVTAQIRAQLDADFIYDWGGGLVWALIPEGVDLRAVCELTKGHATLIRADQETRRAISPFHPQPASLSPFFEGLQRKFDPRRILNPGLMN